MGVLVWVGLVHGDTHEIKKSDYTGYSFGAVGSSVSLASVQFNLNDSAQEKNTRRRKKLKNYRG